MKTEAIISFLKSEFIKRFDAGLLFNIDPDEFNTCFIFNDDLVIRGYGNRRENQFDQETTSKEDIYRYLTAMFLKSENRYGNYINYGHSKFYEEFWQFYLIRFGAINNVLAEVSKFYSEEQINSQDQIYPSVRLGILNIIQARIHIINKKYITEILISCELKQKSPAILNHRVQHGIQRDIKRIEAVSQSLRVYFHGMHDPFVIPFDTYKEVIDLQRHLVDLRNPTNTSFRRHN